jgi:hypothetical protein
MVPSKKLTIHYFSLNNRFYKAKLEENQQVVTLSQEQATKIMDATTWTTTQSRQINDNKRTLIEKTYVLALMS